MSLLLLTETFNIKNSKFDITLLAVCWMVACTW